MISIVICTYNSPELIKKCVNSILKQKTKEEVEILLVDGKSDKETIKVINNFANKKVKNFSIKYIVNEKKLPEGKGNGKWLGFKNTSGDIIGFIDQDNELIDKQILEKISNSMKIEKECFGVANRLYLDKRENLANQIISLIGTDPILAYRSLDYLISVNKLKYEQKKDYKIIDLPKEEIVVTGGNCFFYRRKDLESIGGYIQDVDNIFLLNKLGKDKIILFDKATTNHRAVNGFIEFFKKKNKWGKVYSKKEREFSWIPKNKIERRNFIINFWKIFFIIPLFSEKYFLSIKYKEPRHLISIPFYYVCFFTYSIGILENFLKFRK